MYSGILRTQHNSTSAKTTAPSPPSSRPCQSPLSYIDSPCSNPTVEFFCQNNWKNPNFVSIASRDHILSRDLNSTAIPPSILPQNYFSYSTCHTDTTPESKFRTRLLSSRDASSPNFLLSSILSCKYCPLFSGHSTA